MTNLNNTKLVVFYSALLTGAFAPASFSRPVLAQQLIEYGSDRHGSDIAGADVQLQEDGGPMECVRACNDNSECRAWAFLRSGYFQGDKHAYCKLKYAVPRRTDDSNTASGVRSSTSFSAPVTAHGLVREILRLVNQERQAAGMGPLTHNGNLTNAAQRHTQDMADHNRLSHAGSDGSKPSERVTEAGYNWSATAENIAWGTDTSTSEQVMSLWMNSPRHRANILNPNYREIGVGYVYNARGYYWTQEFGSRR